LIKSLSSSSSSSRFTNTRPLVTALQAKLELMEDERTRAAEEAAEAAEEAAAWRAKCADLQVYIYIVYWN